MASRGPYFSRDIYGFADISGALKALHANAKAIDGSQFGGRHEKTKEKYSFVFLVQTFLPGI